MEPGEPICCVIYAAKSTQDRKGSIREQLDECRAAVDVDSARRLAGEYTDESFSAFRSNRGPGLVDAMQHVEDLAREHGEGELWAQHSDRLARGDGRSARHAVEIALWALKRDVRVRTIQDPGTFRDLLYAVVTGQRNHEDSRRKGLATSAGRRRAAERGDFIGYKPDGYRLVVHFDEQAKITKRMELDPERHPVIEMIFNMALSGQRPGVTARKLNDAGFMTNPMHKTHEPKSWTVQKVLDILKNPRYAGIATFDGEIVARDCWPTYISELEHLHIKTRLAKRRPTKKPRPFETYLLARLGTCGRCGHSLFAVTGLQRTDGTFARRYLCASRRHGNLDLRCTAKMIDADMLEAMLVSKLQTLLLGDQESRALQLDTPAHRQKTTITATERGRLLDVLLAGDEQQLDGQLKDLFARMRHAAATPRHTGTSGRQTRQLEQIAGFHAWAEQERHTGRTETSRAEARRLNKLLRFWFTNVAVEADHNGVSILAERHGSTDEPATARCTTVRINHREWIRRDPLARRKTRRRCRWSDEEIIGALQAWADTHKRSPVAIDWTARSQTRDQSLPQHPSPGTVRQHFGNWQAALNAAGLENADGRGHR